jgi:hypothetical protein
MERGAVIVTSTVGKGTVDWRRDAVFVAVDLKGIMLAPQAIVASISLYNNEKNTVLLSTTTVFRQKDN